ncbi:major facilitator superfamily domain-containing protein [Chaetomium strumarium]|uniref:Major facilitator superfamily domain-containing protein n=1 Tax=Chaetomium strumarium TaxID=1170767 RepID=A0AAJ0M5J3_9PEZI|nr:major facilitator superfamily domain-containing protein [Chaetomium strumarium]
MVLSSVSQHGGTQAWLTVAGGWICQFCLSCFINALGTFQLAYEREILPDESSSNISWILTTQLFLMFFLSQPVGLGVDMFGARAILIPAFMFSVGVLVALSFATEYWQIFLARALVLGIVSGGSSCGGVIFPIMLARLFDQIGFRATLRYAALMIGIMLAIAILLVSSPLPPTGLAGRRSLISLALFKRRTFLLFVSGCFFVYWGLFGPFDYLPLFASGDPATAEIALDTVSIINAASIPGCILPNMYSDRVGSSFRATSACSLLFAISTLVIWLPISYYKSLGGLVVSLIVFEFSSGAFVSLMTPALIEVDGGHSHEFGAMLGSYFAVVAIASLTGLPIQGVIMSDSAGGIIKDSDPELGLGWLLPSSQRFVRGNDTSSTVTQQIS